MEIRSTGIQQEVVGKYMADMPPFTGRHLWVYTAIYQVKNPARVNIQFDLENMLSLAGPGCWYCTSPWRADIGAHCPGDPGDEA